MPFYAVRKGHQPGIYLSWDECERHVKGFSKAVYKKFETRIDAVAFILNKSPNKDIKNLNKDSPRIKNPDFRKESSNNLDQNHKRKLDKNEDSPSNTTAHVKSKALVKSAKKIKSLTKKSKKEIEIGNLRPEKKVRVTETQVENTKTLIDEKKIHLNISIEQKNYLTEYEDGKQEFSFKGQKAVVFTDGACSNNGKPNAIAGIGVYWGKNHPLNISKKLNGLQTNNRAEINAAIVAISQALTYDASELTLYTDSKFMMNSINDWINKWKKNGWKTASGEPIYVPGHKGHHGNEEADKLATQCLR